MRQLISYANQVAKKMIKDPNISVPKYDKTNYAIILGDAFPTLSKSIMQSETADLEIKGKIAKNFLSTLAEEQKYSILVENTINNPERFDPITLMIVTSAVVFILQTEFHASYKDGKLEIDVRKKETSEDLIKKIFTFGGPKV